MDSISLSSDEQPSTSLQLTVRRFSYKCKCAILLLSLM